MIGGFVVQLFELDLRGESRRWRRAGEGYGGMVGAFGMMCLRGNGRGFPIIGARFGDYGEMMLVVALLFPIEIYM